MPSIFKSSGAANIGTAGTTVYTATGVTSTVIGLVVANVTASDITVDVILVKGGTQYHLVKGAAVPVGTGLVAIGGDQKVVLETTNSILVKSSVASGADAVISYMEQS